MSDSDQPSFENNAPLGRLSLLAGAYAPALVVLGLRVGTNCTGIALMVAGVVGTVWWTAFLLAIAPRRSTWEVKIAEVEPVDRDVTAYVATYLLPVLAAKPEHTTGYFAYGLAAVLLLIVAYRADLGAVNPLAYLARYRAYRVTSPSGTKIMLSRSLLLSDTSWTYRDVAGVAVAHEQIDDHEEHER